MPTVYLVEMHQVGHNYLPSSMVYRGASSKTLESLVFYLWVIRGRSQIVILNTGANRHRLRLLNRFMLNTAGRRCQHTVTAKEDAHTVLRKARLNPAEVNFVLISPLTAYTVGNLGLFRRAQICLLRRGWVDFHAPARRNDELREIWCPREVLVPLVTDWWPRVRLLDDEEQILPGLRTSFAGGHHRSTMAVSIATKKGTAIFCDAIFMLRNLTENIPIGVAENVGETLRAYRRIRREADILLPAYDPLNLQRFPGGQVS